MFSDAEATSLVTHIIKVSDWGFPFATTDMRYVAKSTWIHVEGQPSAPRTTCRQVNGQGRF